LVLEALRWQGLGLVNVVLLPTTGKNDMRSGNSRALFGKWAFVFPILIAFTFSAIVLKLNHLPPKIRIELEG
jgi:hypothetical protein